MFSCLSHLRYSPRESPLTGVIKLLSLWPWRLVSNQEEQLYRLTTDCLRASTGTYRLLFEEELSHITNWVRLQHPKVIITGELNLNRMEPAALNESFVLILRWNRALNV